MLKKLFFAILILSGGRVYSCGYYAVSAQVKLFNGYPYLVIYPATQAEIKLQVEFKQTPKLSAYIDQTISAKVYLSAVDGRVGSVAKIEDIARVYPEALSQRQGTGIEPVKLERCK